jgi:hypothetical protein
MKQPSLDLRARGGTRLSAETGKTAPKTRPGRRVERPCPGPRASLGASGRLRLGVRGWGAPR